MNTHNKFMKGLSLLLLFAIVASLFAACGKDPVVDEQPEVPEVDITKVTGVVLDTQSFHFDTAEAGIQITATVFPSTAVNKGVVWASSNESVAVVNETGYVVALDNGSAEITATTLDGGFVATCKVTVVLPEPDPVPITEMSFDKTDETIYIGDDCRFEVIYSPAEATETEMVWTSSDPDIATVDDYGVVTGISKGTVTITATSTSGVKATAKVIVKKQSSSGSETGSGGSGTGSGSSGNNQTSSTNPNLSFGSKPSYPAASVGSDGFLSLATSDILEQYHKYNSDVVAWIYIPGTNINFPVAQRLSEPSTAKNEYYLTHGLDGKSKSTGSCFIDYRASAVSEFGELLNHNTVIYGHAAGTDIFDQLEEVTRSDEWFNKESNRYIYINTLNYKYVFKVFATYYMDTDKTVNGEKNSVIQDINFQDLSTMSSTLTDLYLTDRAKYDYALTTKGQLTMFKDTAAFLTFCNTWQDRVMTSYSEKGVNFGYLKDRDFGVTVDGEDVIVTLYTCADTGNRYKYIVQATLEAVTPK